MLNPPPRRDPSDHARQLADQVPSMLAYWDRELRCRFANRACGRWFGVDADGLPGSRLQDLLGPELFALNEPHVRAVLRGEEQQFERVTLAPDGRRRHSLITYLPDIVDGEVVGFMVQVTEVTRLKEAEEELHARTAALQRANDLLRASESALRQAQRLGQIGSWESEVATDARVWSDELYRILGWPPGTPPPTYEQLIALYEPASGARLHEAVQRCLATGEPYTVELEVRRPDGGRGWVEARGEAVRDAQGRIVKLRGTALEVTVRHLAEEARAQRDQAQQAASASALQLQQQEAQWRELFVQASDGIFIADLQGRYLDVNGAACKLLGCEREDIVGKTVAELLPPAERARLEQSKQQMLQGGTHVAEWSLRRQDGSFVPVEASAKILSDGRWIALVRDISERRRAQEASRAMAAELERRVLERTEQLHRLAAELEAAENRERREIARDLHDDLGQTLAAARIRLSGLWAELPAASRATVDEIAELIDRANRSTRSLAAQLAPAVLYELGLSPALEWLGEEIERTFGIKVTVADDGAPKALSQEARSILYRAARELLINAAKHARSDTATLDIRREDGRIVVQVSDAGVGFDPALIRPTPHRGLGLISVRERLSFIGGTVEVRSVPGDGTVAVLSAPLAGGEPAPEESQA